MNKDRRRKLAARDTKDALLRARVSASNQASGFAQAAAWLLIVGLPILIVVALVLVLAVAAVQAETAEVRIRRISRDLYAVRNSSIFIETRYCYHRTTGQGDWAYILYDPNPRLIVWEKGDTCEIRMMFRR